MILIGSERSGAKALANHLLNTNDNEHVEVHSVQGFMSDDVTASFKEVQAIAKGTKCKKPFFSVSLNPPANETASIETFETAIEKIEETQGIQNQPRIVIFHEKDGRRHAHVVWSRIDAETMTAKNLSFFKGKLQDVSREMFLEQNWKMPLGLLDRSQSNPTNVTLAEWQAAKRRGKNAIDQKKLIQQCWAVSDSRAGFEAALNEYGYMLAKGDRRGHVIICHDGEVFAVARATKRKTKEVRERLGDETALPSVDEALQLHRKNIKAQFIRMAGETRNELSMHREALNAQRLDIIDKHRKERTLIDKGQAARWQKECEQRAKAYRRGLAGVWQWMSGERSKLKRQHEHQALKALQRDRTQRQRLIDAQLNERSELEIKRTQLRQKAFGLVQELKAERDQLIEKLTAPRKEIKPKSRTQQKLKQTREIIPDFDPSP